MASQLLSSKWIYWSTYGDNLTRFLLTLDIPFIPLPPKKCSNGTSQVASIIHEVFGGVAKHRAHSGSQVTPSQTFASRQAKRPNALDSTISSASPTTSSTPKRRRVDTSSTGSTLVPQEIASAVTLPMSQPALLFRAPTSHPPSQGAPYLPTGVTQYQQYSQVQPAFHYPYVTPNTASVFPQATIHPQHHTSAPPTPSPSHSSYGFPPHPILVIPNANHIAPFPQMYNPPPPIPFRAQVPLHSESVQTTLLPNASRPLQGPPPPMTIPQTSHGPSFDAPVHFSNTFAANYPQESTSSRT